MAVEDAARDKVELEGVFADDDRVPGVVAALVAHDHRNLLGEEVGRLPLPFVAPLQADDHAGRHLNPFHWAAIRAEEISARGSYPPAPPAARFGAPLDSPYERHPHTRTAPRTTQTLRRFVAPQAIPLR